MACRYTYQGKTYEAHEFDDVLRAMTPDVASKYMPGVASTPSAPFVTDTKAWTSLALKRMIRYAADNGFDVIAWTTGEQQADRYDLSKSLDTVTIRKMYGNKGWMVAGMKDGVTLIDKVADTDSELAEIVGKDLADKAMSQRTGQAEDYSGLDLKVGGEGMRGYYDGIVPQVANEVLKKLGGGKVSTINLEAEQTLPSEPGSPAAAWDFLKDSKKGSAQPGFVLPAALKEKVSTEGVPLFSTRRWQGTRTRNDYLVPSTPYYAEHMDETSLGEYAGLPIKLTVGMHAGKRGMDHLYQNGQEDSGRAAEPINGDVGEGHIRDVLRTLRYANQEFPGASGKVTLRNGLVSKAVALQKRTGGDGREFWSVITLVPASQNKIKTWGPSKPVKAPQLLDPEAATSSVGYYREWPKSMSQAGRPGLPNSEWFDVTQPDGGSQIPVTVKGPRKSDKAEMDADLALAKKSDTSFSTPRIIGDSGRSYNHAERDLFKHVGREVDEKSIIERIAEWAKNNWKQGVFDQFAPVKELSRHAYNLMRLSKGATGAFEAFMHHGKLSIRDGAFDADTTGGLVEEVFYPLGRETTDFLYWIAGNRAERLAMEGKERLFSPAHIAAAKGLSNGVTDFDYTLANGQVTRDRTLIYKDALVKFNAFQKNVMDMAEQSGLIDGASRKLWEHEFYVPFYRVMDESDGGVRGMNIKQGVIRQTAFKKLKGGKEKLGDLLSNTLMNYAHLIDAAAKNRAAKATIEAAEAAGIARPATPGEKHTVWYSDAGRKAEYVVDDPALLVALNALDFSGLRGMAMDVLSKPKHWLTIGVTASPFFKIRNLIRDSIQAIATSDLSYNPIGNVIEGAKLTARDRQEYVSALASGGLIRFGTMLEGNEAARQRQLIKINSKDKFLLDSEPALTRAWHKIFEPGLTWYNELGNRGEEINRMALYDQMIKAGKSHSEAAMAARDLMDFSLQGSFTSVRFLAQMVPFFNARMQGLYKLGRATKENRAHMATVAFTASLAGLAIMAYAAADDDRWKRWQRREEWDKANYWFVSIGDMEFRIPKPFELGAAAHMVERSVEALFDTEKDKWQRLGHAILDVAANQLAMNPVPQTFKPIVDIYANKDSFTGRPIETLGMQRLDPRYRFNANTSMPARWASDATGGALSPIQIDHLVRGYFAWAGSTSVAVADMLARAMNDEPTRPTLDYFKLATGGMVREGDSSSSRYVSLVYEQARELEEAHATYARLLKEGKREEAKEYRDDNKDKLLRYRSVESVKKQLSTINEKIRMIERSSIHPAEKRIKIRALKERESEIAARLSR